VEPTHDSNMRCPVCERRSAHGKKFCNFCGSPLPGVEPQEVEPSSKNYQSQSSPMNESLREIRRALVHLADRVSALEKLKDMAETPISQQETGIAITTRSASQSSDAIPGHTPRPSAPIRPPRYKLPQIDWEQVLGLNWLAIIGAIALATGVGFFLMLAFENDWIGERGRVILGIAAGMATLGIGAYSHHRYPTWAQAVTGGGLSILYLSIYSTFGFYDFIDLVPAFLFLALLVTISGLLALRYDSIIIALLGIGGAFLTPILLGSDLLIDGQIHVLLGYILLVAIGVLGISAFRNWRWFTMLGLVGSYGLLLTLSGEYIPAKEELPLIQGFLTAIFLVFVGATTLFQILWRQLPGRIDLTLISLNAVAYYGLSYGILWEDYQTWFGLFTLNLSFFYGIVGYLAISRSGASPHVALFSLATALVFLTIATPLQLTGSWITVTWAAQGIVLIWIGFLLWKSWHARAFGLGVLALATSRLLISDTMVDIDGFRPLLNDRFPTFLVTIAIFYVGAYIYWKQRNHIESWESNIYMILAVIANCLTLWIFTAEVIAFFDSRELAAGKLSLLDTAQNAQNGKILSITALWSIYALALLAIALAKRSQALRWAGLGLLLLPVAKLVLLDTFIVELNPVTFMPVLNFHFLTFLIVLAVLIFASYLYRRQRGSLVIRERHFLILLLCIANFVALWGISTEIIRFFHSREVIAGQGYDSAKHLSLTVLWAVYAIGMIGVGIVLRSSRVRLTGLTLLGIPVLKLFVFDVFLLEPSYRVAAFVILGVLLLATGFIYQRYSTAIKGFLFAKSP
jgi:uncharacterized membrane protein